MKGHLDMVLKKEEDIRMKKMEKKKKKKRMKRSLPRPGETKDLV